MINLPTIFSSINVKSNLLTNKCNFITHTVVYDLTAPICSKIFNFNKFVAEHDVDQFLVDPAILCNCNQSPFVDKYHSHILTRDLTIIKNNKSGKIICWNPKYREHKNINFTETKKVFLMASIIVHFPDLTKNVSLRNL